MAYKCNLYKDTHLTIRSHGKIFYGPIKRLYQTYYGRVIEVFDNGEWKSARVVGEPSEQALFKVTDNLFCSSELKLKTYLGNKSISEIIENNEVKEIYFNEIPCEKIVSVDPNTKDYFEDIKPLEEKSDWLFGVKFEDPKNYYYTLTNGMIICNK